MGGIRLIDANELHAKVDRECILEDWHKALFHCVINATPTVDVTELLDMERDRITADTLRNYHAWLLEEFLKIPTPNMLHSIDTAISWLKSYGEYKDINVSFGVERG